MRTQFIRWWSFVTAVVALMAQSGNVHAEPLEGTEPLTMQGDIASQLVDAADAFLLRRLEESVQQRESHWHRDFSTLEAYNASIQPRRDRLAHILGLRDQRVRFDGPTLLGTTQRPARIAAGNGYDVHAIRWLAFADVHGEGLLLTPTGREPIANVIAIPHCDVTPEQLCGLAPRVPAESQFARRLAESGCRVVVPMLVNRDVKQHGISNREWLHRSAFEMGRTMTGYELNKCLAIVDWFEKSSDAPIGVMGHGDGGMLALYAAALDPRIDAACISGAFGELENLWQQPIDRMVFSLLTQFGDAQLAAMIAPRKLIIEMGTAPVTNVPRKSGERGGPYEIKKPSPRGLYQIAYQARDLVSGLNDNTWISVAEYESPGDTKTLSRILDALSPGSEVAEMQTAAELLVDESHQADRHAEQMHEIDRHTQALLRNSHWVRKRIFWDKLETSSIEAYQKSIEPLRKQFRDEVIGSFDIELAAPKPRTRLIGQSPKWKRYEIVLDVFDGLFAYGILTVPANIADGERRPVVVCQHGLEGRPQSVIGEKDYRAYKAFATKLAERGFVTFAPQNLYIFEDRFRTLQRKANPLGKTLFSLITPQHQQIVDWLQSLPFVDGDRVAFYGLSYGGKTAMRVPPLVSDYCLAICSADFNEWVDKNASTLNPRSYVNTGEYEIFEWDLGHTFNYAEMAALIAPRPFMVERGHYDGVADDWTVAWEFARVRFLYAALLKIPDRTEIEWFDGPHSINGVGTYGFLHNHLDWPFSGR